MKKIFHLHKHAHYFKKHVTLISSVFGIFIIISGFMILRGQNPKMSELSFTEKSSVYGTVGSVVPASCDSNGVSTYDHLDTTAANPMRKNVDGTYDAKPCPPTSCAVGQTLIQTTEYYCDYTVNPATGWRLKDPTSLNPFLRYDYSIPCPPIYANSLLYSYPKSCDYSFQANPDGLGMCEYFLNYLVVNPPLAQPVSINSCANPVVNLSFNPSYPTNVSKTCSPSGGGYSPLMISWSPVSGASSYVVKIHNDSIADPNVYVSTTPSYSPYAYIGGLYSPSNPTYTATVYSMPGMVAHPTKSVLANFRCP